MTLSIPTLILTHTAVAAAAIAAYHYGPTRLKDWLLALVRMVYPAFMGGATPTEQPGAGPGEPPQEPKS